MVPPAQAVAAAVDTITVAMLLRGSWVPILLLLLLLVTSCLRTAGAVAAMALLLSVLPFLPLLLQLLVYCARERCCHQMLLQLRVERS
jgi:hypothetical protein